MTDPITCVVADDHPAMLTAVAEVLGRSGFEVVGRAKDGTEALALIESAQPAIAIVDVRMPRLSGIEVAIQAAASSPGTAIVFYTAFGDRALLSEALDVGARGFVLKEAPLADLERAPERPAVATATKEGAPSVRMVLLKSFDEHGLVFFPHTTSRKGRELTANPRAALLLYWDSLGRQVRVEGNVERVSPEESDAYFATRPPGAQAGAVVSRQSDVLESRDELEARVAALDAADVVRPDTWGG